MTYSSGGLIQATDFNGFVSTGSPNINNIWSTGSGDSGWGQSALSTVSVGGTVTATNWASLVNTLSSMGSQTGTSITARSAPTAGQTISVLAAVATDITNCNTNRGNAPSQAARVLTWTGSSAKTTTTGTGNNAWTITWTHTVTFPSADQARYFWNAGGTLVMYMNKTSTGTDSDPDWNSFAPTVTGQLTMAGRVNGAAQTIAGVSQSGFTRTGSGGTLTINSNVGWYSLTPGAAATQMFLCYNTASPYTGDYIQVFAARNAASTTLTFTTYWVSPARTGAGQNTQISGGTDTPSPWTAWGTAPAVIVGYYAPSTTYLSNSWGTPTVAATVA